MTNTPWPEELLQRCVELWKEGRSAKEIGAEVGKSKNAIIGRMRRMRVYTGDETLLRKLPPDPTKPKEPKAKPVRIYKPRIHIRGKLWMPSVPVGDTVCRLAGLRNNTCRWPTGEATGEFQLFCGLPDAELDANRPYCEGHSLLAYRKRGEE